MKPSNRLILIGLFVLLTGILLMAIDPGLWMIVVLFFLVVILLAIADYITAIPDRLLMIDESKLSVPPEIYIGSTYRLEIMLAWVEWTRPTGLSFQLINSSLLEDGTLQNVLLNLLQQTGMYFQLTPLRRGIADIKGIWLFWESPYRLFHFKKYLALEKQVHIYQDVETIKSSANKLMSRDSFFGFKVLNKMGTGSEFKAMRDYQHGMALRLIDWKQTAKHNKLIAREYNIESNHNIIVAFDTGYLMSDIENGVSCLDYSINAGLFLSYFVLAGGDKVGLFSFDEKPGYRLSPVSGVQNFNEIQTTTAIIEYSSKETNFTLGLFELGKWVSKRSLIILFSDFVDTISAEIMLQNISYLNQKHLILFVVFENITLSKIAHQAPSSYHAMAEVILADDFLKEREIVIHKLKAMGVHILTVSRKNISIALLNKYFEIKQLDLI